MNELACEWKEERVLATSETVPSPLALPQAVSLVDLADAPLDPTKTLLGDRFLCVGGGMLFVGPSGIGKSSASVQQDISWALGKEAFGIKPSRPLRILGIQAENDEGDLGEMARGVLAGIALHPVEREELRNRVLYVTEKSRTSQEFLHSVVLPLLERHRPDILRIDPLLAYIGGDVNDAETTATFLRNGLNPLLDQFGCAAILNHHTPKVTNRDTSRWRHSDWMYSGAGSADLTNWCRAALVIEPTHAPGVYVFIAAKRGGRIGWRNEHDERIYQRIFCHATGGAIFWRDANEQDLIQAESRRPKSKEPPKTSGDLLMLVPEEGSISKNTLILRAHELGIGENRARRLIEELLESAKLHELRIPRPRTNPKIVLSRHAQPSI